MYGRNLKLLAVLVSFFIISVVATCVILAASLRADRVSVMPFPNLLSHFCALTSLSSNFYALGIPTLCYETLLFGLALFKGYQILRSDARARWGIMDVLVRDSIFYFSIILTTYSVAVLIWDLAGPQRAEVGFGFAIAMSSVMSQRLLLNVRTDCRPATINSLSTFECRAFASEFGTTVD